MTLKKIDNGYPISYLKHIRRQLADKMLDEESAPTEDEVRLLAAYQIAIMALVEVSKEVDADL